MISQPNRMLITVLLWLRRRGDCGASLVEYALLVALIAVVCIIAITFLGTSTSRNVSTNAVSLFGPN